MKKIFTELKDVFVTANKIIIMLFKIMIPVLILMRVLEEFDLIKIFGIFFSYFMSLVGLPENTGFVVYSSIFSNLYGAMGVMSNLPDLYSMNVKEATVLSLFILIAHNYFTELAVTRVAGVRLRFIIIFRTLSAFSLAYFAYKIYELLNIGNEKAKIFLEPIEKNIFLKDWIFSVFENLFYIILIIYSVLIMLKIFDKLKVTYILELLMYPILKIIGISKKTSSITAVGAIVGLAYGGGILIEKSKNKSISDKEIFLSFCFLNLCHALIEDTLLMVAIGGDFYILLMGRLLFAIVVMAILSRIVKKINDNLFYKYLFHKKNRF